MSDVNASGIFLSRELEQKLPKLYEKKYPQYWAAEGMYHKAEATLEKGTASITEQILEGRGEALALSDYNTDFPTNQVSINESSYKVIDFVTKINYTFLELWAAEKAGKDIISLRLNQAYKTMQEKIHRHAVFGNTRYGHQGLFSHNLVTNQVSAYNPNTSTWQQDLDFFRGVLSDLADSINNTAQTGYIMIPPKLRFKLASTYQTGDSGATVMQALMDNFGTANGGYLKGIIGTNECRSSELEREGVNIAGSNLDRIVFIPDSEDYMSRYYYPMFITLPQVKDLQWQIILVQGTSEIISTYPKEVRYVSITRML